jgi:hypothetical protein
VPGLFLGATMSEGKLKVPRRNKKRKRPLKQNPPGPPPAAPAEAPGEKPPHERPVGDRKKKSSEDKAAPSIYTPKSPPDR